MISYYPPLLFPYLQLGKNPAGRYARYFFQSWEDGFWHLLDHGVVSRGAILIPDFYCLDVVDNLRAHGMEPVFYPLDRDFQPDLTEFTRLLQVHRPACVIIFYAAGLPNLLDRDNSWREYLPSRSIVVHDHVHHLLDESRLDLPSPRDIALDSLRKNIPLSGSFLYARPEIFEQLPPPRVRHLRYLVESRIRYILFRTYLNLGYLFHSPVLVRLGHKKVLRRHDDLIGDSVHGNPGPLLSRFLSRFIAFGKISRMKKTQIEYYQTSLRNLPDIYLPPVEEPGSLHAFPMIVRVRISHSLESSLSLLNVWTKFPDSPWSENRRVFFLPLGPHITVHDQADVISAIRKSLSPSRSKSEEHTLPRLR